MRSLFTNLTVSKWWIRSIAKRRHGSKIAGRWQMIRSVNRIIVWSTGDGRGYRDVNTSKRHYRRPADVMQRKRKDAREIVWVSGLSGRQKIWVNKNKFMKKIEEITNWIKKKKKIVQHIVIGRKTDDVSYGWATTPVFFAYNQVKQLDQVVHYLGHADSNDVHFWLGHVLCAIKTETQTLEHRRTRTTTRRYTVWGGNQFADCIARWLTSNTKVGTSMTDSAANGGTRYRVSSSPDRRSLSVDKRRISLSRTAATMWNSYRNNIKKENSNDVHSVSMTLSQHALFFFFYLPTI